MIKLMLVLLLVAFAPLSLAETSDARPQFDIESDLISLHYDHAPDRDDGHSAAADRMILETMYGRDWVKAHTVAVSGAYGRNAKKFNPDSDAVMEAVWAEAGGWHDAHREYDKVVEALTEQWLQTLRAGGDIWVKEGGQSDITADMVKRILASADPQDMDTTKRIHVIQHSRWNENQTRPQALAYVKQHTNYIKIPDANAYLNIKGGDRVFEQAAIAHPTFGKGWQAAFVYYPTSHRLDFSDTGELLYILELGRMPIDQIRQRFLQKPDRDDRE